VPDYPLVLMPEKRKSMRDRIQQSMIHHAMKDLRHFNITNFGSAILITITSIIGIAIWCWSDDYDAAFASTIVMFTYLPVHYLVMGLILVHTFWKIGSERQYQRNVITVNIITILIAMTIPGILFLIP